MLALQEKVCTPLPFYVLHNIDSASGVCLVWDYSFVQIEEIFISY